MNQVEKYECATQLLKELNCPEPIMDALWLWSMSIESDQIKLNNWLSVGGIVEGECREVDEGNCKGNVDSSSGVHVYLDDMEVGE